MPYNKSVTIAQITDGTSNTMMVAEQSNYCANTPSIASWYRSANGQVDCLSDGGSFFFGFFRDGNPRIYNSVTVRSALNDSSPTAAGVNSMETR